MKKRSFACKLLSIFLAATFVLGLIPSIAVFTAAEEGAEETRPTTGFSGSNLMNIDTIQPENFATTTNPYGYDVGIPFLMVEQNELMVFRTHDKKVQQSQYFELGSNTALTSFVSSKASTGSNASFTAEAYLLVQGVSFDPTGSGRRDHVAFIGIKSDKEAYLWVVDTTKTGTDGVSSAVKVGNMAHLWDGSTIDVATYQSRSVFDIVAGDFDGDGKENIIIYTPQALKTRRDKTKGDGLKDTDRGCIIQEWKYNSKSSITKVGEGYTLLLDAYTQVYTVDKNGSIAAATSGQYRTDNSNGADNLRNKLGVSMVADDFNGDGVDDLAVLSFASKMPKSDLPSAYFKPTVKIVYGQKGNGATVTTRSASQSIEFVNATNATNTKFEVPTAASLTCGDIDGDGDKDLFLGGMLGRYSTNAAGTKLSGSLSVVYNYFYLGRMTNNGNGFTKTYGGGTAKANTFTQNNNLNDSNHWQRLAVEAVAINGHGAAELVFVNGTLYSNVDGTGSDAAPVAVYTDSFFKDHAAGTLEMLHDRSSVNSVAVGNFDGNSAGREQVIYTAAITERMNYSSVLYVGYMGGTDYSDTVVSNRVTEYGTAGGYTCSVSKRVAEFVAQPANFLLIPVDRDHDGVVAKYRGAEYAYTDPSVKAVLQAAPYFADVSDAGNNESVYVISEIYDLSQSTSDYVSYSVGYSGEFGGDVGVKVSIESGYAMEWTQSFEESLETVYAQSFSAQAYNSVVVNRIPVFMYLFDIQKSDGSWHNKTVMQTAIPQAPVYEQLSIDAYNRFVDEYNAFMAERNNEGDYFKLEKIDPAANWMDGNEGNPYAYNHEGWGNPDINAKAISQSPMQLGYNGTLNKVAWEETNTVTKSTEMAHGFYFGFTLSYGFLFGSQGVSTNLEYTHGKGRSVSKGSAVGASCTVTDIDGPGLREEGVPEEIIQSYGFQWTLGQWERHLSGEPGNKTLFIGFNVTNLQSPAEAVSNLKAKTLNGNTVSLTWSKPERAGYPEIVGYYIYMQDDEGNYQRIGEMLPPDIQAYTLEELESNTEYTFVITTVKTVDHMQYESIWSPPAYALTSKNNYVITIENDVPKAFDMKVKHLGNVEIFDGDEIIEESVVKVTASSVTNAYELLSIEITQGTAAPLVLKPDGDGEVEYSFVLTADTVIRLVSRELGVSYHVSYTEQYALEGLRSGSVRATVGGTLFESGSIANEGILFTATPAEGYVLDKWVVLDQKQTQLIPSDGSNFFTLLPEPGTESESYIVSAVFVKESAVMATVRVISPINGAIEITDGDGTVYTADANGEIPVTIGKRLTFEATASDGYVFAGWVQDAASESTKASFEKVVENDFTVGAEFEVKVDYVGMLNTAVSDLQGKVDGQIDPEELATEFKKITDLIDALDATYATDAKAAEDIAAVKQAVSDAYTNALDKAVAELEAKSEAQVDPDELAAAIKKVTDVINALDGTYAADADVAAIIEALDDTYAVDADVADAVNIAKQNVTDAKASMNKTIDDLTVELNNARQEIESKDDMLQTFSTVVCVISSVSLCGSGAFAVWFFIDRRKRI